MFRDFMARALMGLLPLIYWIGGLWVLMAEWGWLADKVGAFWASAAVVLLPVMLVATPLVAGFMDGQWAYLWLSLGTMGLALAAQMLLALTVTWKGGPRS